MSSFNPPKLSGRIKPRTLILLFLLQSTRADQISQNIGGRNSTTNFIRETNHDRQDGTDRDFDYNFHLIHNEKSEVSYQTLFRESTDESIKRFKRTNDGVASSRDKARTKVAIEFDNKTAMVKAVNYESHHGNQSVGNNSNIYSTLDLSIIGSPLKDIDSFTTEYWSTTEGFLFANTTECPDIDRDPELCNLTKEEYIRTILEYIYPSSYEWIFIVTYAIVFVIGLVGNALVCVAVYRNHSMRTVTNYFIVNLAVADFMVILICLPSTVIWDVTKTWFFGNALCRIILYFQSVSVTVSVLTLTFISVDRWYAICFPLKFKSTTGRAKTAILIIWLLSLTFNVPEFVVLEVPPQTGLRFNLQFFMQCTPTWSKDSDLKWHIVKAIFLYTLPLLLMMIAYCQIVRVLWRSDNIPGHSESNSTGQNNVNRRHTMSVHANASTEGQLRSRRKAAKMLVAVVAMFAFCYLPVHVLSVLRYAFDMPQTNLITFASLMSHVLCYVNSAINPLIYNFMSGKFRREFHRSFFNWPCWCCGPPTSDRNGASFAPIGSSRAGTSRTIIRRNDSCVSYRLTHLSPSNNCNSNSLNRTNNTSFIENNNSGNARKANNRCRDHSIGDNAARLTLTSDVKD